MFGYSIDNISGVGTCWKCKAGCSPVLYGKGLVTAPVALVDDLLVVITIYMFVLVVTTGNGTAGIIIKHHHVQYVFYSHRWWVQCAAAVGKVVAAGFHAYIKIYIAAHPHLVFGTFYAV